LPSPDGTWDFHARAENVGYRDQEFMGSYEPDRQAVAHGSWQQIPQFYSVDTMTPYTGSGGTLLLDDATQRAIQNGDPAKLNLLRPAGARFRAARAARHRPFDLVATPKPNLDVTASFTTQKHSGELPFGASFGFSNDVEVALPTSRGERLHPRHRVDEQTQHAACRLQRLLVRQPRADAGLGQPAPP
jgi:hypothetical protein